MKSKRGRNDKTMDCRVDRGCEFLMLQLLLSQAVKHGRNCQLVLLVTVGTAEDYSEHTCGGCKSAGDEF